MSGQELHQEIKATINQMKENYLAKKK